MSLCRTHSTRQMSAFLGRTRDVMLVGISNLTHGIPAAPDWDRHDIQFTSRRDYRRLLLLGTVRRIDGSGEAR
jgi:hypothetical protein